MDADTTKERGSMETILRTFKDHEADILIGTQMIVKGHDFPKVTLVGILAADMSLSVGDYRAAERTFDLLTQAAGRAGRGEDPGEVVIQTYQPEHYSIVAAAAQDYLSFYKEEIIYRKLASYPPVWHMLAVMTVADEEKYGLDRAGVYKEIADGVLSADEAGYTIGPAPAAISKLRDRYRSVLYIKHKDSERLVDVKDSIEEYMSMHPDRHVLTFFDFDPLGSL
jgi:primosomal protein N' (replication factor Y)